jgi:hypothetical protein
MEGTLENKEKIESSVEPELNTSNYEQELNILTPEPVLNSSSSEPVMFSTLIKWYEHSFEKFGWMFLARDYNYPMKITAYLESIKHLISDIELKMDLVDSEKKKELEIMLRNSMTLQVNANVIFKITTGGKLKRTRRKKH